MHRLLDGQHRKADALTWWRRRPNRICAKPIFGIGVVICIHPECRHVWHSYIVHVLLSNCRSGCCHYWHGYPHTCAKCFMPITWRSCALKLRYHRSESIIQIVLAAALNFQRALFYGIPTYMLMIETFMTCESQNFGSTLDQLTLRSTFYSISVTKPTCPWMWQTACA